MALAQSALRKSAVRPQAPRGRVVVRAASRPTWLPGAPVPSYLDGSLAGDFGFDPLGLGKDPASLRWYTQAELIHGRTAMAAAAGILIPAILTKAGVANIPAWYEAGTQKYFTNFGTLVVAMHYLYGFVEIKRWADFRKPGSQSEPGSFAGLEGAFGFSKENGYPGGAFDPLGLSRQGDAVLADYKLKEIKNGRLAMLATLGFAAQYYATGKGPIDNLIDHVTDSAHNNFAENGVSVPGLGSFLA